jgi:very-short-patch-repair endonuclease
MDRGRVRRLRKNPTEAEQRLWKNLRLRQLGGFRFRRQQPLGEYIVDFVCFERRLIIEVDGGQHSEKMSYDSERDEWLKAQGFSILRFWNHQVLTEIESVKEIIYNSLKDKASPPP